MRTAHSANALSRCRRKSAEKKPPKRKCRMGDTERSVFQNQSSPVRTGASSILFVSNGLNLRYGQSPSRSAHAKPMLEKRFAWVVRKQHQARSAGRGTQDGRALAQGFALSRATHEPRPRNANPRDPSPSARGASSGLSVLWPLACGLKPIFPSNARGPRAPALHNRRLAAGPRPWQRPSCGPAPTGG